MSQHEEELQMRILISWVTLVWVPWFLEVSSVFSLLCIKLYQMIIWGGKKVHCQLCSEVLPQKLLSKQAAFCWPLTQIHATNLSSLWNLHGEIFFLPSSWSCGFLLKAIFSANIQRTMINVTTPLALMKLCVTYSIAIKK